MEANKLNPVGVDETEELKPRVFVTNYGGHDYDEAKSFGEIRWVTRGFVSFQSLDRVKFLVAEAITDSRPDDYLLISGRAIISVLAALVWFHKHSIVRLLVFDQKGGNKYREVVIKKSNLDDLVKVLGEG